MKVFEYIWKYKGFTVFITLLLLLQAALSFIIPFYTSKIIDIGIQQGGIENSVPVSMSKDNYNTLICYDSDNIIKDSYSLDNDTDKYNLNNYGISNFENLDKTITAPIAFIASDNYSQSNSTESLGLFDKSLDGSMIKQKAIASNREIMKNAGIDIGQIQLNYLFVQGAIMLAVSLLSILSMFAANSLIAIISSRIGREKRKELFNNVMNFSSEDINSFSESSLITRSTNDIQNLQSFCELLLRIILYAPICIIVGLYFAITTAVQLSWIIVVAAVAVAVGAIVFRNFIIKYFRQTQKLLDKVNLFTWEMLSGILVNRAFNKANYEEKHFDEASYQLYKYQLITGRVTALIPPIMGLGTTILSLVIILLGGFYVSVGSLQIGQIMAYTTYTSIIIGAFSDLGRFIGKIPQASVTVNRLEEVIDYKSNFSVIKNNKSIHDIFNNKHSNKISFNDVWYSYDNSKTYAVENLNFSFKTGQTLGIIGTVGSGKSTILSLLLRLFDVTKGNITINDVDIKDIDLLDYRALFSFAPQQSFLFSGTVKSNVSYGVKDKYKDDDKYLMEYIDIAQAADFIKNSEVDDGLNKKISQDSINISGGQRQRLSIARALASNKPILVFDDCFSALDYGVEKKLRTELSNHEKGKTKIIVTSRLSSILDADNILVMHEGNLVGNGTHEYLMKNCTEYIKIAKSQLDKLPSIEEVDK